jgi:hypothetical protein
MQLPELRKAIDDATWAEEWHKAEEFQQHWLSLKPNVPPAYRPIIEDRLAWMFAKYRWQQAQQNH